MLNACLIASLLTDSCCRYENLLGFYDAQLARYKSEQKRLSETGTDALTEAKAKEAEEEQPKEKESKETEAKAKYGSKAKREKGAAHGSKRESKREAKATPTVRPRDADRDEDDVEGVDSAAAAEALADLQTPSPFEAIRDWTAKRLAAVLKQIEMKKAASERETATRDPSAAGAGDAAKASAGCSCKHQPRESKRSG